MEWWEEKFTIPKKEILMVRFKNSKGIVTHIITSTVLRDMYYLYEIVDGKAVKTKYKAENPKDLEKYVKWK